MKTESTNKIPVACMAPPLDEKTLKRYRELADESDLVADATGISEDHSAQVQDTMKNLLACVEAWWELPESGRTAEARRWIFHNTTTDTDDEVLETPLEREHIEALWEVTPWMRELDTLSNAQGTGLFDSLPNGELRNAAFHLLWYCKELTLDREPMTRNLVKKGAPHTATRKSKKTAKKE